MGIREPLTASPRARVTGVAEKPPMEPLSRILPARPPTGFVLQRPGFGRELNRFFKALSDETRRNILRLLEHRPRSVGEIVSNFELSQPTISRHLAVLKEADLVSDRRRGQHVIYRLNGRTLTESARRFFREFRHGGEADF